MKNVHRRKLLLKIRNSKLNQEVQILWQRIFSISKTFGSKRNFATTVFQERMSWTGMLNQFTKGNPLKGKALDFENLIWENSDRSLNEKFVYLLEIKFWFLLWWIRLNLLLIWFIRGSDPWQLLNKNEVRSKSGSWKNRSDLWTRSFPMFMFSKRLHMWYKFMSFKSDKGMALLGNWIFNTSDFLITPKKFEPFDASRSWSFMFHLISWYQNHS